MIQANELRIGNWILLNNEPIEVYGTLLDYCSKQTDIRELYPIPLTPEILEKCDFSDTNFFFSIHDGGVSVEDKPGDNAFFLPVKYLHQLQNLYYALTFKELEITF